MKNRLHLIRPGKTFANILLNINCFKILPQMTRGSSFQEEFVDFLVTFRSSHADVFHKKVFLDILQNSQENSCARVSFLIKLQTRPATLLKKRLWHRCFPVNFAKFLRAPFLTDHFR